MTPDPGGIRTADPKNPGSWNRYAYVNGDPVNFNDPSGRMIDCPVDDLRSAADGAVHPMESCGEIGGGGDGGDEPNPCLMVDAFNPVPSPACYAPGPPVIEQPPALPPTCEDVYGIPSSVEAPQLAVLLGENSWGKYSASAVSQEDLYMEQAMYNLAAPKGFATSSASVDLTINTDTYRGYPHVVDVLHTDLDSPATSATCADLTTGEGAYEQFWSGSQPFSNVNRWRSASARGPVGTQIAGTIFWYSPSSFYSPGRPVRRPTPPIRFD